MKTIQVIIYIIIIYINNIMIIIHIDIMEIEII